jgi:hypothetical protein
MGTNGSVLKLGSAGSSSLATAGTTMQGLRPCPNCGSSDYEYGWAVSEDLASSLGELKAFKPSALANVIGKHVLGFPRSLLREVVQRIPATPVLVCKHCRVFVVVCPRCGAYSIESTRPSPGEVVNCSKCKFGFCGCERSAEFDRLLHKNPTWSWWSKALYGGVIGVALLFLIKAVPLPL